MTDTLKPTQVIQADREAAAQVYANFRDHDYATWIRRGENATGDADAIIQTFARHRATHDGEREALIEALERAEAAMREMFRYFDGGETRGSYDGRPERDGLRRAWYSTRSALQAHPRNNGNG